MPTPGSEVNTPAGWELTGGATCDDGSNPSSIDLSAGETVTCTFNNTEHDTIGDGLSEEVQP